MVPAPNPAQGERRTKYSSLFGQLSRSPGGTGYCKASLFGVAILPPCLLTVSELYQKALMYRVISLLIERAVYLLHVPLDKKTD
ncbi:MAG TPA: hypothetical protein DCX25_00530 [Candidatus Pacebacteria bacterium]|nr:hypothetical protein [Candidatus Paceibacterota bacterium]HCR11198.1 hypothetical protein [Candidatus Paceibacterota bacterium]HCR92782.1 hypothetical protein [Candidatus Paceibacterota bacterium]